MAEAAKDIATVEETKVPAEAQDATSLMAVIANAARDPNVDVDKMRALLDMKKEVERDEAERQFNHDMRQAQSKLPEVLRDAKNETTRSRYATLEKINEAITPIVTGHGFSMSFGTDDCPLAEHYRVTCVVSHEGGHSRSYHADVPADLVGMKGNRNKTATHGFGSTMSYGRRYLTLLIFNVTLTDEDDDGQAAGTQAITEEQCNELLELAEKGGASKPRFCQFMGVESFADIPASQFEKAKKALQAKQEKSNATS